MQKWEYCVLKGVMADIKGLLTSYPRLYRFSATGAELVTDFQQYKSTSGASEQNLVAKMIYELGEEGWEMVYGQPNTTHSTQHLTDPAIWFKRPKD